jgi:hypothetical protein
MPCLAANPLLFSTEEVSWGFEILHELESHCQDRDPEWILYSPDNETRTGPYLVLGPY